MSELELRADCARCVALCCVAPAFSASADFGIDKPAGTACPNLGADFRCTIHDHLRSQGFPGCTVYDCFGAGQQVTQITFPGQNWRDNPKIAGRMFTAFTIMRHLHELLWYLTEATRLQPSPSLTAARTEITALTRLAPDQLLRVNVGTQRESVDALLNETSLAVRSGLRGKEMRGSDLIGRDLSGRDLRAANLAGANLSTALFLTQPQLNSALGNAHTSIPATLTRPTHWSP